MNRRYRKMKRILLSALMVIVVAVGLLFPGKIGTLPGILNPEMVVVSGDKVFAVQGAEIFTYSLKDLSLTGKFGKKGEGPGEVKVVPVFSNNILVYPDYIFMESMDKLVYFSRDGKFIKEKRCFPLTINLVPVGNNFVGKAAVQDENRKSYGAVTLFNSNVEKIKELYRQEYAQQGANINLIPDSLNIWAADDKLFIDKSPEGFVIDVYDREGKKLYRIQNKYEKIKVTGEHKKNIIETFKQERLVKIRGWENVRQSLTFHYPDYFPAIQDFLIADKKIYVRTFKKKADTKEEEYVVMDLKGSILKTLYLPQIKKSEQFVRMIGMDPKFYSITKNKFYYLVENEDEEEWELHVKEIK